MASTPCFAVPQTVGSAPRMLLGQRRLVRKRADTGPGAGLIPDHAGQWAPFGDRTDAAGTFDATALQLFLDQTGINLGDSQTAAKYGVSRRDLKVLQDSNYRTVYVLYLILTDTGLDALKADVMAKLGSPALEDGVFLKADTYTADAALSALGPVPPPQGGWRKYLITNVYGGVQPGALDGNIDVLTARITSNAKDSDAWYRLAVQNLEGAIPQPQPQPQPGGETRLVDLRVIGAERTPSGTWYQAYSPGQNITVQAVTDPAQPSSPPAIAWQGGQPDATGLPQLRAVPLGTLTPFGQRLTVQATLGSVTKSVQVMVVPNLLRFDVSGAEGMGDGKWGVDPEGNTSAVVRVVTEPPGAEACRYLRWTGGEPCPDTADNCCRLVPASAFNDPSKQMPVDVKVTLD